MAKMKKDNAELIQDFLFNIARQNNTFFKDLVNIIPHGITLWDTNNNNILSNNKAIELFGHDLKNMTLKTLITEASPLYQPNNQLSKDLAKKHIQEAIKTGTKKFKWLHITPQGENLPVEITLTKIEPINKDDSPILAIFTQDLRSFYEGDKSIDEMDDYFLNTISYKMLFTAITNMTEKIFFMFDTRTSQIQYYGHGTKKLELTKNVQKFPDDLLERNKIHPDDKKDFLNSVEMAKKGIEKPCIFRSYNSEGNFRYFRTTYNVLKNKDNAPVYIVGKIEDIDDKIKLEDKINRDLLTTCYNKIATETAIKDLIENEKNESYTFYMIDIDNFKGINDTLGHYFGDMTLSNVGKKLKSCFRNNDIVGRIGGDEFVIFAKNTGDENTIIERAEKIAAIFRNSYSGEKKTYKISSSIGISQFPKDGNSFLDLYKSADKALYKSKQKGKDCYTIYSNNIKLSGTKKHTKLENSKKIITNKYDTEFTASIFTLLFEADDIQLAINAVLSLIGKNYNVDRCYILQSSNNGKVYKRAFEWCNKNIIPQNELYQDIPQNYFNKQLKDQNKNTIFYNNISNEKKSLFFNLLQDLNIKSYIISIAKHTKNENIIFGIGDCKNERIWQEEELNTLHYLGKFFSTFLRFNKTET